MKRLTGDEATENMSSDWNKTSTNGNKRKGYKNIATVTVAGYNKLALNGNRTK